MMLITVLREMGNYCLIDAQKKHPVSNLGGKHRELPWRQSGPWFHIRVLVVSVVESTAPSQVSQKVAIWDVLYQHHDRVWKVWNTSRGGLEKIGGKTAVQFELFMLRTYISTFSLSLNQHVIWANCSSTKTILFSTNCRFEFLRGTVAVMRQYDTGSCDAAQQPNHVRMSLQRFHQFQFRRQILFFHSWCIPWWK